jgi:hypothetical protein
MTIESLKGLDLLGNATPLPASVSNFINTNIALGSGLGNPYRTPQIIFDTRSLPDGVAATAISDPRWSEFMNTYAIWEADAYATEFDRAYTVRFPRSNTYAFTWQVDNSAQIYLDGELIGTSGSNFSGPSAVVSIVVTEGEHTLSWNCQNAGDVGGLSLTVTTGSCGSYIITDFFGTVAGIPMNRYVSQANELIAFSVAAGETTMLTLLECYDEMRAVVDGSPPFTISVAGVPLPGSPFADYDSALAALITRADQAVGAVLTAIPAAAESAVGWTAMAQHFANEAVFQGKAGIDFATIPGNLELPTTVLITGLAGYGQDTSEGGTSQFLESIANTEVQAGQALVGAMREGRNNEALDAESVKHDNVIPDQPSTVPEQATLSDGEYTVTEARALAGG